MFTVRRFSEPEFNYVEVTVGGACHLFKYQEPFALQSVKQPPNLENKPFILLQFSIGDSRNKLPSAVGELPSEVIRYYRKIAKIYRAIWLKLDAHPPDTDNDVLNQFHAFIGSKAHLTILDLSGCDLSQTGIEFLNGLENLKQLILQNCKLSDGHLQNLSIFPKLQKLNIANNQNVSIIPYHPQVEEINASHTGLQLQLTGYLDKSSCLKMLDIRSTPLAKALCDGLVLDEKMNAITGYSAWIDWIRKKGVELIFW